MNIFYLEHPEKWRWPVHLESYKDWMEVEPAKLSIAWNPELLLEPLYRDDNNNTTTMAEQLFVDIHLFGYKEEEVDGNKQVKSHAESAYLYCCNTQLS